jgi:hypothetical protein
MSEDSPTRYTKEWVREEWDYEQDTGRPLVILVKLIHEWYPAGIAAVFAPIAAGVLVYLNRPTFEVVTAFMSVFGGTYAVFLVIFWCTTLAE